MQNSTTKHFFDAMTRKTRMAVVLLTTLLLLLKNPLPIAAARYDGYGGYSVISQKPLSMISPFGRRRYRSRRRRYVNQRRPAYPPSTVMHDYSKHFLDNENWMTDKNVRIWNPQSNYRKRANERSWTGRLAIANIVCYAIQSFNPRFTQWGVKLSERIMAGKDLYRLITPVFLHGGIYHLFTNMYSLNNVGPMTEACFGHGRFLATYLVAGVSGNLLSAMKSPHPALGASGAVFGVMSSFYVFLARNEWALGQQGGEYSSAITQTLVINLLLGAVNPMVDNWGHIGGAIGGAAMSWYFGPRLFLAELPISNTEKTRIMVDKPVMRLPPSIESLPTNINKGIGRLTRRMKIWGYVADLPDKPWRKKKSRQQQQKTNYRRRQYAIPDSSIKPSLPE